LRWAVRHHQRHGAWPTQNAGPVAGAAGEDWGNVAVALRAGCRGLPGGDSLARLLERRLGVRNRGDLPPLSAAGILAWADDHRARSGSWPNLSAGAVAAAPGETWGAVDDALRRGGRGLPGGSSLAQLLEESRGRRNRVAPPPLTEGEVVAWAFGHHEREGEWPSQDSGAIPGTAETWGGIAQAPR